MAACDRLASAKQLKATTTDYHIIAYLAGHAVELILVAIGIKQRQIMDPPGHERGASWHNLPHLLRAHGLEPPLYTAFKSDPALRDNWLVVKDWVSDNRFPSASMGRIQATSLLHAVAHSENGVFQWFLNRYDQI